MNDREVRTVLDAALRDHRAGRLDAAVGLYQRILDAAPDCADAWHLLGLAAHQKGDPVLARRLIETAIGLADRVADFHSNLGMVMLALGDGEAALASLRRAVTLDPDHAKALANLAGALRALGALDEALVFARRSVEAAPDDPETLVNLANVLRDLARLDEAFAAIDRALAVKPDYALAHWNRSLVLLARGDYLDGFAEFSWRWRWPGFPGRARDCAEPKWTGGSAAGKTILLYPEQGLGDAIQFVRYAALVRAQGARVIVEVPGDLAPLIARAGLADQVVSSGARVGDFDSHAPFLDLPAIFKTTLDTVPAPNAYLIADPAIAAEMRARTARDGGRLRIGLNWSGNPQSPVEVFRAVPPPALAPLGALPGIDWICLQKGPGGDALARPPALSLIETGEGSLDETAALIATLDCVVTTDTAVAHLAGALGVPTLLLLHHAPDWRWLAGRAEFAHSSPWYPSIRLFRQASPGDWAPVVAAVADSLRKRV